MIISLDNILGLTWKQRWIEQSLQSQVLIFCTFCISIRNGELGKHNKYNSERMVHHQCIHHFHFSHYSLQRLRTDTNWMWKVTKMQIHERPQHPALQQFYEQNTQQQRPNAKPGKSITKRWCHSSNVCHILSILQYLWLPTYCNVNYHYHFIPALDFKNYYSTSRTNIYIYHILTSAVNSSFQQKPLKLQTGLSVAVVTVSTK